MERMIALFLIVIYSAVLASSYQLSLNEDKYGENLVRVMREAEALWVRENRETLYDYLGKKNHRVELLQDDMINHILKNEKARELAGIDKVNMTPYIERVRASERNASGTAENEQEISFEVRRPKLNYLGRREGCIRSVHTSIFDPFANINAWMLTSRSDSLNDIFRRMSHPAILC